MDPRHPWLTPVLLESLSDGFVFLDRSMRYVYVNEAAERLLLERDALIGRYAWDVFPELQDSPIRYAIDRAAATGKPTHTRDLHLNTGIWLDCSIYPSQHGLAIIFRDISEQKRAQTALAESEARFRMVTDAAPVLIWMSGLDKGRTYFNRGWLEFTGRTIEQDFGMGWTENVHPDDVGCYLDIYNRSFDRREPFFFEYRLRRHDGVYRWILAHGEPLSDSQGRFIGFIGSCIDIHERRHAEDQLSFLAEASSLLASSLEYEQTLRNVARLMVPRLADWCIVKVFNEKGSPEIVTASHVDPEQAKRVQEMIRRYPSDPDRPHTIAHVVRSGSPILIPVVTEELLDANIQDEDYRQLMRQIGCRSLMTVPFKSRDRSLGAIMMVWAESGNQYNERDLRFAQELAARASIAIENARLYGKTRQAEAELRTLNETLEDRVRERTSELEREVQERIRAEETLERVISQLEERNQELQDFAYVASHDLQEPLRKVHAFADLLAEDYAGVLDAEGIMYIQRIQDASTRMSSLIKNILLYSRTATGSQGFQEIDLNDVISGVLSDLEIRIQDVNGTVKVDQLPTIEADPLQMRQLFQNLIGNALKFHRPDAPPIVHVTSQTRSGGTSKGGPLCQIKVTDNGIGLDQKYAERIFMPFKRLHSSKDYQGTGVGLAICRRIVLRHRGSIDVRSKPGEGATFIVTIPVRQSHTVGAAA